MTVVEGVRRGEILDAAAEVFATLGTRASLKDIAGASGIFAGSLYHHFESKEAIVIELVRRYREELDALADRASSTEPSEPPLEAITTFGTAIARCAVRNRAALLLSFYDPPSGSAPELIDLANRSPLAIDASMTVLLRRAAVAGLLRPGLALDVLADRLCQSMLHVGIGVYHRTRGAEDVPALKCRMLLEGLAVSPLSLESLDSSVARHVADAVIDGWTANVEALGGRRAVVLAAARSEFGRRGYDATTIRDVAAVAGINPGAVYRIVESKEQLLGWILSAYVASVTDGWDAVLRSKSAPLEKLDALLWLNINLLDRFSVEHKIQSVSFQVAPLQSPNLGRSFSLQLAQMRRLLAAAQAGGELRLLGASADMRARCAFALSWIPENLIRELGPLPALTFARSTLLQGAAVK